MRLYPQLPPKATVYMDDDEEPLAWDRCLGGLVNMAYNRGDITVLYSSAGDALGLSDRSILSQAIVLKYRSGILSDETSAFRKAPLPYIPLKTSAIHALSLSSGSVRPGNSFSIGIRERKVW